MTLAKDYTSVSYALQINGKLAAADALGWQDQSGKIAATPQCTYNVASISKIYCTAAVMILVQRGLVELDTPVVQYVPAFIKSCQRIAGYAVEGVFRHGVNGAGLLSGSA